MCNLYSGQSAICDLFSAKHHRAGNLPPLPAIWPYPDNARRSQSMARGRPPVRSRCSGHFRMTYCTSSRKDERAGGVAPEVFVSPSSESDNTPPQTSKQPSQGRQQGRQLRLGPVLSWFHRTLRDVWFYVAAVSLIFNLVHTFRPQLSIQVAATIPDQPALTLFTLTNTGSWTLYNITTKCAIWSGHNWLISQGNIVRFGSASPMAGNPNIHSLGPTEIATGLRHRIVHGDPR